MHYNDHNKTEKAGSERIGGLAVVAGLMWLTYYSFEHGRKLQEESDTTL